MRLLKPRWYFLDREGEPIKQAERRPEGANPINGDENTPWYKLYSHVHYDKQGEVSGVHYFGTYEGALYYLKYVLDHQ